MDIIEGPDALFVGDLDDPWVRDILESIPGSVPRMHLVGDLPQKWPAHYRAIRTLILHRPTLSLRDRDNFERQRRLGWSPRLLLCVGSNIRYADIQAWADVAEVILPESTARETLARHLAIPSVSNDRRLDRDRRPSIAVVSRLFELGEWIEEVCGTAGYAIHRARSWRDAESGDLAIWDVAILEPSWTTELAEQAGRRPVLALLGLADRSLVQTARDAGAAACLDLPCTSEDLLHVLEILAMRRARSQSPRDRDRPPSLDLFRPRRTWSRLRVSPRMIFPGSGRT